MALTNVGILLNFDLVIKLIINNLLIGYIYIYIYIYIYKWLN